MTSVHDVAAYILKRQGSLSTMKLQKLLYYSQAWHLAWEETPLFEAEFQAWANGPVVHEVFNKHRGRFTVDSWDHGDPAKLSDESAGVVDMVLEDYGPLEGHQLSRLTHSERPWREAREGTGLGERSSAIIEKDRIQDYYTALWADDDATPVDEIDWD